MADERGPAGERLAGVAARFEMDARPFGAVVGLTLLALVARLVLLGARPMHFDEGRVAYWGLRAVRTGVWSYQPVVHGPLVQHFNRWLFAVGGSSDLVARLPVALVGGLLPLAALLYRDRLEDLEVAALAGLLAVNPLLLYYSRYMRSDVLVAAFAFVTLGALVRLYETRRPVYLYGASAAFALAFASKENAIVYVLCWVGMFGLVAMLEVADPRRFDSRGALAAFARDRAEGVREAAANRPWVPAVHALGAVVLFGLLFVFLFARRAPPGEGVGLWHSGPVTVLQYVVADATCGLEFWSPVERIPVPDVLLPAELAGQTCHGFPSEKGPLETFPSFLGRELQVLGKAGAAVALLSVVGVLSEFRRDVPRVFVPAAFYWGLASLVGYPVGTDILFPAWLVVHAIVPLAVPAAVGVVRVGEWTVEEVSAGEPIPAAALGVAVLLLVGSTAGAAVHHSYVSPTGNHWSTEEAQMVQFAQPEHAMKDSVDATRRASASTDGLDVLVYDGHPGDTYALVDGGGSNDHAVPCMKFLYSLPLSWYFYSFDAQVDCADNASRLDDGLAADPPVVLTREKSAPDVRQRLGGEYVSVTYELRRGGRRVTFFFDPERVEPPAGATRDTGNVR